MSIRIEPQSAVSWPAHTHDDIYWNLTNHAATPTYRTLSLDGSTSGTVVIAVQATTSNTTYTLPSADGTSGYVLATNGAGQLSWIVNGGGGGTGIQSLNGQSGNTQLFANDTNVSITSATNTHTIGWSGQLSVGRGGTGLSAVTENSYVKGNGSSALVQRTYAEVKTDLSLSNVENTALSTWAGTANITTLGTITTGTWTGTAIADAQISSAATWNGFASHKTTEDAINGIVKVNGAGTYSAVTDNSSNWNTAYGWGNHASAGYTTLALVKADSDISSAISLKHAAASVAAAPLTISTQAITFNYDTTSLGVTGNNLYVKGNTGHTHSQYVSTTSTTFVNVASYSILPANSAATNDANWATLLAAVDTGSTVYFPAGHYNFSDDIDVTKSLTICGDGIVSVIHQTVAGKNGVYARANGVYVNNLRLTGPLVWRGNWVTATAYALGDTIYHPGALAGDNLSYTCILAHTSNATSEPVAGASKDTYWTSMAASRGIYVTSPVSETNGPQDFSEPDTGTYETDIGIFKCYVDAWEHSGINLRWVKRFSVIDCYVDGFCDSGIAALCSRDGRIEANRVDNIYCGYSGQGYGIIASWIDSGNLAKYPRPRDISINGNVVTRASLWEGIDTHGGLRITVEGNIVRDCYRPILLGSMAASGAVPAYGADYCTAVGNSIYRGALTEGEVDGGIIVEGLSGAESKGCVVAGNTVNGMGIHDNAISGGIIVYGTRAVSVTGNSVTNCTPNAVCFAGGNYGFEASGNMIMDPWTDAAAIGEAIGVKVTGFGQYGSIVGNAIYDDATTGKTYTLREANGKAIRVTDTKTGGVSAVIVITGHNFHNATSGLVDDDGVCNVAGNTC